jgi:hypothetical protein
MSLFGLDPESVEERVRAKHSARPIRIPTLTQSLIIGGIGFGCVGVLAFSVWAFAGRWLYLHVGEGGLYFACAALFIGLAGLVLHKLVIGPGTLGRFYGLFGLSFGAYAIAWCMAWFLIKGKPGEWTGSLAGSAIFAFVIVKAFSAPAKEWIKIALVLFATHSAGYFGGAMAFDYLGHHPPTEVLGWFLDKSKLVQLGMLFWGLAYGVGFGIGIGYALYAAQESIRASVGNHPSAALPTLS